MNTHTVYLDRYTAVTYDEEPAWLDGPAGVRERVGAFRG